MFFYEIWNDTLFLKDKNMKFLKVTILAFIVVAFTSCDCLQHIQGVVVDSETRLPINKVMVKRVMAKEDSIRDVIAFPKVKDASCLMTNAPDVVDDKQLEELSLDVVLPKEEQE